MSTDMNPSMPHALEFPALDFAPLTARPLASVKAEARRFTLIGAWDRGKVQFGGKSKARKGGR